MRIYMNGSLCEQETAVVSVYDHGFLYGIGLFETFRTYGGRPFLLEEHLRRLEAGCRGLEIEFHPDAGEIRAIVARLLAANDLEDGYFRLSVSAGEDILGLPAKRYEKPNLIVYVKALPAQSDDDWAKGRSLQRLKLPRNSPEGAVRTKSFHYMNSILGKRELAEYPWAAGAEGLLMTRDGFVAEGLVSNLFFVSGGSCFTPAVETGILPGITRDFVIRLLAEEGSSPHEGYYRYAALEEADEIFLTNSIQEIVPVCRLFDQDGNVRPVGGGTAGPVTRRLRERYLQLTRRN